MSVGQEMGGSLLADVSASPRALVFLTVPWSAPERTAWVAFRTAVERLAAESPTLGVACFSLDEEAEWCQAWLASLDVPQLGGNPLGAGSMLWLESGRAVSHEIGGCQLPSGGIVARTCWLWARPATLQQAAGA